MNDLIKKNLILAVVIVVTLVMALVMLYVVSRKYGDMKKSLAEVEKLRDEINELNKKQPAPVQENIDRVLADCKLIGGKTDELQAVFGKPYHLPLVAFVAALDEDSVFAFKEKWREYQKKKTAPGVRLSQVFMEFLGGYDRDKVEKGLIEFKRMAEARSVEVLSEANVGDVVMEGLGYPRAMSPEACRTYIAQMQFAMVQMLRPSETKVEEHLVLLDPGIEKFTFGEYDNRMPLPADVGYIVKNWKMIEDLAFRLKESRVERLIGFSRRGNLKGREENGYLIFSCDLEIESSLDSARDFLNSLQQAYVDHRVYLVRELELTKVSDEVGSVVASVATTPSVRTPERRPPPGMGAGGGRPPETAEAATVAESNYGHILIGQDRTVKIKLVFDYMIYVGDESQGG